jgi:hypothetical protein
MSKVTKPNKRRIVPLVAFGIHFTTRKERAVHAVMMVSDMDDPRAVKNAIRREFRGRFPARTASASSISKWIPPGCAPRSRPQGEGRAMSTVRNLAGIALMGLIAVPLIVAGAVTYLLLCVASLALNLLES